MRDALFTGMNNLEVITTTSDEYSTAFGFTEKEVFDALDVMGLGSEKEEVKKWYLKSMVNIIIYKEKWKIRKLLGRHKLKRACQLSDADRGSGHQADDGGTFAGKKF